jgi:hypothetical protein
MAAFSPPCSVEPLAVIVKVALVDPLTARAMLLPSVPGVRATNLITCKRGSNAARTAGSPVPELMDAARPVMAVASVSSLTMV